MSTETWSPLWAPHCSGTYERAFDEDGRPEPTWVRLSCSICNQAHQVKCESGAPREWVQRWASAHLHRDVMGPMPPGGAGAGR